MVEIRDEGNGMVVWDARTPEEKKIAKLQADIERLKDMLIEERLPNFCTGVECGCAGRVVEARKKARIRLRQELEQAIKESR